MKNSLKPLYYDNDGGIHINNEEERILDLLSDTNYYSFKLSKHERVNLIALYLTKSLEPITMQQFADRLFVSRSTILHDMNAVKKYLSNYDLNLISNQKGLSVQGRESDRRIFLLDQSDKMSQKVVKNTRERIKKIISNSETQFTLFLTDKSFDELFNYILILSEEQKLSRTVEIDYILRHPSMQTLAEALLKSLVKEYGIQYTLTEEYLLSDILYNLNYLKRNDIDDQLIRIQIVSKEFIDKVSAYIGISIQDDYQFYQNLVNHLHSSFKDIQMQSALDSSLTQKILDNNPNIIQAIQYSKGMLEEIVKRPLTDYEISLIAIHVKAAIERRKQRNIELNVLVVCDSGRSSVQLLVMKLKKFFHFNIIDIIPSHAVDSYDTSSIDLIISTLPLDCTDKKSIVLQPNLSDEDCILLGEIIDDIQIKKTVPGTNIQFLKIQNSIAKSIMNSSTDKDELYINIIKDLQQLFYPELGEQWSLSLLLEKHIIIDVDAENWQEAIMKSAEPLLSEGYFNSIYVEQMIQNVLNNGPYVVIAPHFALVHEAPNKDQKLGMSLIRLTKEISFGSPRNDPVRYVCCLSTQDKESHVKPIFHLMSLLRNPTFIENLDKANSTIEIMQLFYTYEQML